MSSVAVQRGFTLLEILVSFTLMAIVLTLMYNGIRIVHRVSNGGEQRIDASSQIRIVHRFLRNQLTGILPVNFSDNLNQANVFFIGEEEKIQFVATMPGHLRQGGVYKQTIRFVRQPQGSLEFMVEPVSTDHNDGEFTPPVVLLEVEAVLFQYLDAKALDNDPDTWDWSDEWQEEGRIPALIRIDVTLPDEEKTQLFWPSLVVAPVRDIKR